MAVPTVRDRDHTAAQLSEWLCSVIPDCHDASVDLFDSPKGSGFSSETIPFDATWIATGADHHAHLVARVMPAGYTLYQQHDLETQWRVIDALHRRSDVPVPRIVGAHTSDGGPLGRPFFVMERVDGVAPADVPAYTVRGWLAEADMRDQAALFDRSLDVLARIHRVDVGALCLDFLAGTTANPAGIEEAMVHDEHFLEWVAEGRELPLFEEAARWLRAHLPTERTRVLTWCDARLGNMLFRDFAPVAVLDWEMVTLGPPDADVGWWLFFNRLHSDGIGKPPLPGFPTESQTVERYQELSGNVLTDLDFFVVRAAFRGGLLLVRYTDMLVARGLLSLDAPHLPHTPAVTVLSALLDG